MEHAKLGSLNDSARVRERPVNALCLGLLGDNLLSAAWVLADKIILQTKRSSLIPLVDGVKNCFYLRIILLVVCACIDHTLR
jgi:hypothetical protein